MSEAFPRDRPPGGGTTACKCGGVIERCPGLYQDGSVPCVFRGWIHSHTGAHLCPANARIELNRARKRGK
jgi:hypothetical protein